MIDDAKMFDVSQTTGSEGVEVTRPAEGAVDIRVDSVTATEGAAEGANGAEDTATGSVTDNAAGNAADSAAGNAAGNMAGNAADSAAGNTVDSAGGNAAGNATNSAAGSAIVPVSALYRRADVCTKRSKTRATSK